VPRNLGRCVLALAAVGGLAGWSAGAQEFNGFFPARGQGDAALSYTHESYDQFWVGTAKLSVPDIGTTTTTSFALWLRYGLTDRLAVIANVPYIEVTSDGLAGFEDSGLQDLSGLLVFKALESGSANRHRLVVGVGGRTELSDYQANSPVSIGDGTTDVLLRAVYQFEHRGFYLAQQVGYDLRGGDAPDGLPLYTEVGNTWGRFTLDGFYLRYVARGGTDIGDPGFTFPSNKDETVRIGAKVFARVSDVFGVFASGFSTLDGRNSGDATGYSLGITYRF
jgi:hypothetical protein